MAASPSRRRLLFGMVVVVVAIAAGAQLYLYLRKPAPPVPPDRAAESLEPAVVAAVRTARERVLKEPRSAAAWGTLGKVFFANEMEDEALACFEEAEWLEPGNFRWPYLRSMVLINRGDRDAALPLLRRVVQLAGDDNLAPRLVLIEQLLLLGHLPEAEGHVKATLRLRPDDPRVQYEAALLAVAKQDFPAARDHLERCLASPHTRQKARLQLASVCLRLSDPAKAAQYQDEAGRTPTDWDWIDPVVAEYAGLAVKRRSAFKIVESLEGQGRYGEALRVLAPVVEEFPEDDVAQLTLGKLLARSGDFRNGVAALRRAEALAPRKVQPHYYLSLVLLEEGKNREKAGDKTRAVALYVEAEASARRALAIKPDYGVAHMVLGQTLKNLGHDDDGVRELEEAVRCNPEHAELHLQLADMLFDLGRTAAAVPQYEQALRLAPPDAPWRGDAEVRLAKGRAGGK